jgi:hypothetical protein
MHTITPLGIIVPAAATLKQGHIWSGSFIVSRRLYSPSLDRHLQWENTVDLPKAAEYTATILSSDKAVQDLRGDRTDLAGYIKYGTTERNPGAIVYRGNDLGETTATINSRWISWEINGRNRPTPAVDTWLSAQFNALLLATIAEHAEKLRAIAVDHLRAGMERNVKEMRNALNQAERDISGLLKQVPLT